MLGLYEKARSVINDPEDEDYDGSKPTICTIEYTNGSIVAYSVDEQACTVYIDALEVPIKEQKKGYGSAIVEHLINKYDYFEFRINAKIDKVSWWEKFGFEEGHRDESFVGMIREADY